LKPIFGATLCPMSREEFSGKPMRSVTPESGPFALLRLLADGGFRSGEALAELLGCSRATVWNRVRAAEALGARLHKVRGRGYRLATPLDLLDAAVLARRVESLTPQPRFDCGVVDECESTSTLLMTRARRMLVTDGGTAHGTASPPRFPAIACERQTAGRGRRGAAWHDALGGSLAVSASWRFARGMGRLSGMSLAAAVAVARALEQVGCRGVRLKWPNDLMIQTGASDGQVADPAAKLGGILTELAGDASGPSVAVIGIGLNVRLPTEVRAAIGRPVADLANEGGLSAAPPARTELLARVLSELGEALAQFEQDGFAPFRAQWLERHAWQGRRVALRVAERQVAEGEAMGVDDDGALLLASRRGLERFHSGELSLRPI